MDSIKQAIELKEELDALRPLSADDEQRIWQKFRLDWNYHSNHLEGNTLTYGETKALILFNVTASGKPLQDTIEMAGHNEAIKWITEIVKQERPINEQFIKQLHEILFNEPTYTKAQTLDGKEIKKRITPGQYKSTPNHVETSTGELFRFATPEETPAKMGDLIEWYREKETEGLNPILLASEFHYKFIRIHPFDDGNGRMARILMNFTLMKFGYPPVVIKTEDKENYYAVLRLADAGEKEPFNEYIGKNLVHSLGLMIAGAKGESIEEPDDIDKEISLLEQKLENIGASYDKKRSANAKSAIIHEYLEDIIIDFKSQCVKFNKFYDTNNYFIKTNSKQQGLNQIVNLDIWIKNTLINPMTDKKLELELIYIYQGFNKDGFESFNNASRLFISFNLEGYTVYLQATVDDMDSIISKNYGEELSMDKVKELIKSEMKRHMDMINKRIELRQ